MLLRIAESVINQRYDVCN